MIYVAAGAGKIELAATLIEEAATRLESRQGATALHLDVHEHAIRYSPGISGKQAHGIHVSLLVGRFAIIGTTLIERHFEGDHFLHGFFVVRVIADYILATSGKAIGIPLAVVERGLPQLAAHVDLGLDRRARHHVIIMRLALR